MIIGLSAFFELYMICTLLHWIFGVVFPGFSDVNSNFCTALISEIQQHIVSITHSVLRLEVFVFFSVNSITFIVVRIYFDEHLSEFHETLIIMMIQMVVFVYTLLLVLFIILP